MPPTLFRRGLALRAFGLALRAADARIAPGLPLKPGRLAIFFAAALNPGCAAECLAMCFNPLELEVLATISFGEFFAYLGGSRLLAVTLQSGPAFWGPGHRHEVMLS